MRRNTHRDHDWLACVSRSRCGKTRRLVGVLDGEGVGGDLVRSALQVLDQALQLAGSEIDVCRKPAAAPLAGDDVMEFCQSIFEGNGVILAGAYGGRRVYDLRKTFKLFCKLVPIRACPDLNDVCRVKPEYLDKVDILLVRENCSGFYQGEWHAGAGAQGSIVTHTYRYHDHEVKEIADAAVDLAAMRRGRLTVVLKDGGAPAMSKLWRDVVGGTAADRPVDIAFINIDYAVYLLVQNPRAFDVILAPNLFGDIIADLGGIISGSRGVTFSGNFARDGAAIYQTNHGAALDLQGENRANPVGQIFALSMLLRHSCGLLYEASLIDDSVVAVWRDGYRTFDLAGRESEVVGTSEMTDLICNKMTELHDEAGPVSSGYAK